ncbi:MAG: hypothetical protein WCD69_12515 [Xanthobacteraceae bacterium]
MAVYAIEHFRKLNARARILVGSLAPSGHRRSPSCLFDLIRRHGAIATAVHCAFDLLELDGKDLRRQPIEEGRRLRATLLHGAHLCIVLDETFEEGGATLFREACRLGCNGIVPMRLGSPHFNQDLRWRL